MPKWLKYKVGSRSFFDRSRWQHQEGYQKTCTCHKTTVLNIPLIASWQNSGVCVVNKRKNTLSHANINMLNNHKGLYTERFVRPSVPGDPSSVKEYVFLSYHRQRVIARLNLCLISNSDFTLTEESPPQHRSWMHKTCTYKNIYYPLLLKDEINWLTDNTVLLYN